MTVEELYKKVNQLIMEGKKGWYVGFDLLLDPVLDESKQRLSVTVGPNDKTAVSETLIDFLKR